MPPFKLKLDVYREKIVSFPQVLQYICFVWNQAHSYKYSNILV